MTLPGNVFCYILSFSLSLYFLWANLSLFFLIFVLFKAKFKRKNWKLQQDSNSDRQSRPLEHHHGHKSSLFSQQRSRAFLLITVACLTASSARLTRFNKKKYYFVQNTYRPSFQYFLTFYIVPLMTKRKSLRWSIYTTEKGYNLPRSLSFEDNHTEVGNILTIIPTPWSVVMVIYYVAE